MPVPPDTWAEPSCRSLGIPADIGVGLKTRLEPSTHQGNEANDTARLWSRRMQQAIYWN